MGTNGTIIAGEPRLEQEIFGVQTENGHLVVPLDSKIPGDFTLAPLVDKIAFGIARGLVETVKELELHIASETRMVGQTIERRLDTLQMSLQELSGFVKEQRSTNAIVQEQLRQLTAGGAELRETYARQAQELEGLRTVVRESSEFITQRIDSSTASLREADARQSSELEALRTETKAFSSSVSDRIDVTVAALQESDARQAADLQTLQLETRESSRSASERIESLSADVGVQQEDIAAVKTTLGTIYSRIDALVERLDRQGDALRLMQTTYSQRETELEQLVDGLVRLRAFPKPQPSNGF